MAFTPPPLDSIQPEETSGFTPPPVDSIQPEAAAFTPPPPESIQPVSRNDLNEVGKFTPPPPQSVDQPGWFQDKAVRFAAAVGKSIGATYETVDRLVSPITKATLGDDIDEQIRSNDQKIVSGFGNMMVGNQPLGPDGQEGGFLSNLSADPTRNQDVSSKFSEAAGALAPSLVNRGSIVAITALNMASAYSEAKDASLEAGKSEDEANLDALKASGFAAITLPAYLGIGRLAAKAAAPLASTLNPFTRAAVSGGAAAAANVTTSAILRKLQGGDLSPDAASLIQDFGFAGMHAFGEVGRPAQVASAAQSRAKIESIYDQGAKAVQDGTMSQDEYDAYVKQTNPIWKGLNDFLSQPENQKILSMQQDNQAESTVAENVGPATERAIKENQSNEQEQAQPASSGMDEGTGSESGEGTQGQAEGVAPAPVEGNSTGGGVGVDTGETPGENANPNAEQTPPFPDWSKQEDSGSATDTIRQTAAFIRGNSPSGESSPVRDAHSETSSLLGLAASQDKILPSNYFEGRSPFRGSTMEHAVYPGDNNTVEKITKGRIFGYTPELTEEGSSEPVRRVAATASQYLDRIADSNDIFGDNIKLKGVQVDSSGHPHIVTEQPLMEHDSEKPIQYDEIRDQMAIEGFRPVPGTDDVEPKTWYRPDGTIIDDFHTKNAVRAENGAIVPIDVQISRGNEAAMRARGWDMSPTEESLKSGAESKPASLFWDEPHLSMGGATPTEYDINRTINGADIYNGLYKANGEEPTKEQWQSNFEKVHPDLEQSEYDDLYEKSKQASHDFDESNGDKPMPQVVGQLLTPKAKENFQGEGEPPVTGTKQATVEAERKASGLPALEPGTSTSERQTFEEASRQNQDDPQLANRLVAELTNKTRSTTPVERAVLAIHRIALKNRFDALADNLSRAYEAKDDAAIEENRVKLANAADDLNAVDAVLKKTGSQSGKDLRAIQTMYKQDYSLQSLLRKKQAANPDRPLTDEQKEEVLKQAKEIKDAQDKIDANSKLSENPENKEVAEKLVKDLQEASKKEPPKKSTPSEDRRLKAFKTRAQKRIDYLKDKIARGDFTIPPKRASLGLDEESQRLQAEKNRLQDKFDEGIVRDRLSERTPFQKAQDTLVKWRRGFILSGYNTLFKLSSAALERVGFNALEEAVGGAYSRVLKGLAAQAPREGGANIKIEANAISEGFTKGMRDAWQTLKTGKSDLDLLYGKSNHVPRTAIDFLGSIHGALKSPVKRSEFTRSLAKRLAFASKNGEDITDPAVQTRHAILAYKDAQRSIFMQDNAVTDAYKRALSRFSQVDKETGKVPGHLKAINTAANILLPIVKIPTNIAAETFQYTTGLVTGSAKLALAARNGFEKLGPNEADLIMREVKKGSIGAAFLLLGFFNPESVGGYYVAGQKKDENKAKEGSVKLFGHEIPKLLVHNPLLEQLQIGATIRQVASARTSKSNADPKGILSGIMAAGLGLTEEIPFVNQMTQIASLYGNDKGKRFINGLTQSLIVPQLLSDLAKSGDQNRNGTPIKRRVDTPMDAIQSAIPGLREKLPQKR